MRRAVVRGVSCACAQEIASLQSLLDDAELQQRKAGAERRAAPGTQRRAAQQRRALFGGAAAARSPLGAVGRGSERAASEGARSGNSWFARAVSYGIRGRGIHAVAPSVSDAAVRKA
ncbi:unnamed protein product [Symbiodinium sp. CCMP2592]|nr:unnamed protein product [Symbiodinium sp. CCMP2592]